MNELMNTVNVEIKGKGSEEQCKCEKENCGECGKCSKTQETNNMDKWRYTLYIAVLFLLIINPLTYKFVNMLLGKIANVSDKSGCPTRVGMLIHALLFSLLFRVLLEFKK